jgi:hypothetical protein
MNGMNNLFNEHKTKIMIVIGIIILYISYLLLKKYVLVRDPNDTTEQVLIKKGMDVAANNSDDIIKNNLLSALDPEKAKDFIKSSQLTTFFYVYLTDFDANFRIKKNIVFKRHSDNGINFQWSISPRKNNVEFEIRLSNGLNGKATIKDIQLRTWTSFACIVDGNQANLFKNGKYYRSVVFNGIPVFVNTPILLGKGFTSSVRDVQTYAGFIGTFYVSYKAEDESLISKLSNMVPPEPKEKPTSTSDKCPSIQTQLERAFTDKQAELINYLGIANKETDKTK